MPRELVIAAGPGEWRAALVEDGEPVELRVERGDGVEAGSIHLGRVVRLLPALGAAQVDIGGTRPAFLPQSQILPRGRRLAEGERVVVQIRREAQGGKAAQLTTAIAEQADIATADRHDPPQRLFPAPSFAAALAGVFPAVDRILVDEPGSIPEIRAAFPSSTITHLPESEWPFDLDALFEEALSTTITLPGCGSIHFEPSRVGVLIDVDSGTPEGGSPERTAIAVNLAAAAAIARHIRLRNFAGGIVIDFVGLDDRRARERVRATLARCLAQDRLQPQILGWTRLGHLEVVRRRRTRPLADALLEAAPGAFVKTAATVAYEALRAVRRAARAEPGHAWRLSVAPEIAAALAGEAAAALREVEQRLGRSLIIVTDLGRDHDRFQIEPL
ncbi:MAG: ribonuclease E/G [Alphaproteobacteria bacterium]|nr:ribonuclease E/G [Alphaproteobacteria bacterium]